jgi:acetyl esterase/lipase
MTLQDAQRALKYIRSNASKWGIKPDKVGIQGSSAGGHLASLAGISTKDIASVGDSLDKFSAHPDFMILVSPVVDLDKYAHKGSRKTF